MSNLKSNNNNKVELVETEKSHGCQELGVEGSGETSVKGANFQLEGE